MIDEKDLKILEKLDGAGYKSPRAIRNHIGPISYHGTMNRLSRLEVCGLVLGNNGGGEWRIEDLGRKVLKEKTSDVMYSLRDAE